MDPTAEDSVGTRTGAYSRTANTGWRSSPSNLFNPGYSDIYFSPKYPTVPPFLMFHLSMCILDGPLGSCVGQLGKQLLLKFLGDFLLTLVTQSSLLSQGGRAFSYEMGGNLTGASHGVFFVSTSVGLNLRLAVWESGDKVIAGAGQHLRPLVAAGTALLCADRHYLSLLHLFPSLTPVFLQIQSLYWPSL